MALGADVLAQAHRKPRNEDPADASSLGIARQPARRQSANEGAYGAKGGPRRGALAAGRRIA